MTRIAGLVASTTVVLLVAGCQPRTTGPVAPAAPPEPRLKAAEPLPEYVCERAARPPKVDGDITDPAWQKGSFTDRFTQWDGSDAHAPTVAKLLWDDRCLYVAFSCPDTDIQGTMKQRDDSLWEQNEVVELFADAGGDGGCYLEFEVNPLNTVVDLVIPQAGAPGPIEGKKMWDAKGMETGVQVDEEGWTCEMAILFTCFLDAPNTPPRPGDEWRTNLYRVDAVSDQVEFQAWSPTNTPEPSFHVPERFGVLTFAGEEGGRP